MACSLGLNARSRRLHSVRGWHLQPRRLHLSLYVAATSMHVCRSCFQSLTLAARKRAAPQRALLARTAEPRRASAPDARHRAPAAAAPQAARATPATRPLALDPPSPAPVRQWAMSRASRTWPSDRAHDAFSAVQPARPGPTASTARRACRALLGAMPSAAHPPRARATAATRRAAPAARWSAPVCL